MAQKMFRSHWFLTRPLLTKRFLSTNLMYTTLQLGVLTARGAAQLGSIVAAQALDEEVIVEESRRSFAR